MENESSIWQPMPTAVLAPTEIIAPPDPAPDNPAVELAIEQLSATASRSINIFANMMFASIAFWSSFSTAYFRMFGLTVVHSLVAAERLVLQRQRIERRHVYGKRHDGALRE